MKKKGCAGGSDIQAGASTTGLLHCRLHRPKTPPSSQDQQQLGGVHHVLRNVNCPGELLDIVGPSGAGKSTLLEILAGCLSASSPPPDALLLDGAATTSADLRRVSGHVTQRDVLFPLLPAYGARDAALRRAPPPWRERGGQRHRRAEPPPRCRHQDEIPLRRRVCIGVERPRPGGADPGRAHPRPALQIVGSVAETRRAHRGAEHPPAGRAHCQDVRRRPPPGQQHGPPPRHRRPAARLGAGLQLPPHVYAVEFLPR